MLLCDPLGLNHYGPALSKPGPIPTFVSLLLDSVQQSSCQASFVQATWVALGFPISITHLFGICITL